MSALDVPDDWRPDAASLNALPAPLRRYIHALETNADPAGLVRENVLLKDEIKALEAMVAEGGG